MSGRESWVDNWENKVINEERIGEQGEKGGHKKWVGVGKEVGREGGRERGKRKKR